MKKFAALLLLILWSVSMTVSASASMTVLCVEKSGKAAFEYSSGTHCGDANRALSAQPKSADASVHCAECVDSSLVSSCSASTRLSDEAAFVQIATYVTALLDTTHDHELSGSRGLAASVAIPAMRSAYIGQRETIVIQQ